MAAKSLVPGCEMSLYEQILAECEVMLRYAMGKGIPVPRHIPLAIARELQSVLDPVDSSSASQLPGLVGIHNRLSKIIAPATARTLLLLAHENQARSPLHFLGPLPLIRHVMVAAIVSLVALIWISLSPNVNAQAGTSDILKSSGIPLLLNELFFLSAAGLGASFATLFRVHRYIVDGNYDPKYDTLYWSRFILGIIAGLILVEFVPIDAPSHTTPFARPLLAILGGFSATVVYQILSRLVESVGSIVQGDVNAVSQAEQAAAEMRSEVSESQHRMEVVGQILKLQSQVHAGMSPEEALRALQQVAQSLLGGDQCVLPPRDEADDRCQEPSQEEITSA